MSLSKLLRSTAKRAEALADLEEVYQEVFGKLGDHTLVLPDQPNIYADYDRCIVMMAKMRHAIDALASS